MKYLKATAVGLVSAIAFAGAWTWAALQVPLWWQMWRNPMSGVASASVESGSVLLAALIGFAVGFAWIARRARR